MTKLICNQDERNDEIQRPSVASQFGRDEMNLIEFPFGPIKPSKSNILEVEHVTRDRVTKQPVVRKLVLIGSEAFGLPRPVDEQVLIGLKALTQEAGFHSREVNFSQYHLCRTLGWTPDGKATNCRFIFGRSFTKRREEESGWD